MTSRDGIIRPPHKSHNTRLYLIHDPYVDRCLDRGASTTYTKSQVLRWLHWLAGHMVKERQTIFLIEKMQPTWLAGHFATGTYWSRLIVITMPMIFLILGLYFLLIANSSNETLSCEASKLARYQLTRYQLLQCVMSDDTFAVTLPHVLVNGLTGSMIAAILVARSKVIAPLEKLSWSWTRMKAAIVQEFSIGFGFGIIFALWLQVSCGVVLGFSGGDILANLIRDFGLVGLVDLVDLFSNGLRFGVALALASGLDSSQVTQQSNPNQGMRDSVWNSVLFGISGGIFGGLLSAILHPNRPERILIDALVFGILFGLRFGGSARVLRILCKGSRIQVEQRRDLNGTT